QGPVDGERPARHARAQVRLPGRQPGHRRLHQKVTRRQDWHPGAFQAGGQVTADFTPVQWASPRCVIILSPKDVDKVDMLESFAADSSLGPRGPRCGPCRCWGDTTVFSRLIWLSIPVAICGGFVDATRAGGGQVLTPPAEVLALKEGAAVAQVEDLEGRLVKG